MICSSERGKYGNVLGFTLIEMMVVIGLIAIIMIWAIPGLKKSYTGFKISETMDHINTYVSSFRSYYLIKNQFPSDTNTNLIYSSYSWCLPSNYFTRNLYGSDRYYLNIKPYKGSCYDVDGWIASGTGRFLITIYCTDADDWNTRFREKYPTYYTRNLGNGVQLGVPEVDSKYVTESGDFRNRYY